MRQRSLTLTLAAILLTPVIWIGANAKYWVSTATVVLTQPATTSKPLPAPARWRPLIGEYVRENETVIVLESDGKLGVLLNRTDLAPLRQLTTNSFEFDNSTSRNGERIQFSRDSRGKVTQVALGKLVYTRKPLGPEEGANQLKVQPLRPVPVLIK